MGPLIWALIACAPVDTDRTAPTSDDEPAALDRARMRRLARDEYQRTLGDLLGFPVDASDLPPDDAVAGFDHLEENAATSPLHVEIWERKAELLASAAMRNPEVPPVEHRFEGEGPDVFADVGGSDGSGWMLWSNGAVYGELPVTHPGLWRLTARAWATQAGDALAALSVRVDGLEVVNQEISANNLSDAQVVSVEVPLEAGLHELSVHFTNDYWEGEGGGDRNLVVDWFAATGPLDGNGPPNPFREALLRCEPTGPVVATCARANLEPFVARAWRRPATDDALAPYLALVQAEVDGGAAFDAAITAAVQAILVSPRLLFHVEEPLAGDPTGTAVDDYALASRLSYFLWSSMPDDTLLAAARAGRLQDPHNLAEQAVRMLHDPKSSSLVDNFAGQWLYTRAIADLRPDPWLYPDWDDELARDMVEEARTFFQTFLDEQRPLTELFTAQDTTISARLAAHYGVPAPTSNPGPVSLGATDRRGVLGQAGLLAATSYPTRTSPVKRGKFILDQLLCESPKPPPANISGLIEPTADAVTVRQRLEVHRANPGCASCHATMDPLGFGLERYDALGVWRTTDNGAPVDASGLLPDGRRFEGARELGAMIATDPRFSRCATEKLYTYALARQPSDAHSSWITTIEDDALSRGFSLESLVLAIVTSEPFRTRGGAQ